MADLDDTCLPHRGGLAALNVASYSDRLAASNPHG